MKAVIFAFLIVAAPILFVGAIGRVKAIWAGRKGFPLLQPLYDIERLLKKGQVISTTTSFVFRLAPVVSIAAAVFAATVIPGPGGSAVLSFPGDFVIFAYTLAFARFVLLLGALDTGSSFEGMGASREATFSTIVEPAFFLVVGSLALATGETSFSAIFHALRGDSGYLYLVRVLCGLALFIMLLAEGSRVPVDDPNTHLELTMIHEVIVLDYSGPDLAFIHYSGWLRMVLVAVLITDLASPAGVVSGVLTLVIGLALLAIAVGALEALIARARMTHVPQFIFAMTALALTAVGVVSFFLYAR